MGVDELCLGPRGFAKTTVRAVIRTIWKLTENPNEQFAIISDTTDQAVKFMSEIKQQLETNEYLRLLYPELSPGRIWTNKEITITGATNISKEASVTALGVGQGTGSHFDDILLDDIVDFDNVKTKHRRDNLEHWVNMSLMPMLKAGGTIHLNGTRYHQDDYYGRILEKGIINNLKHNTHKAIQDNGTSLWEQMWPIEKLQEMREERGSVAFNAQYQNDTTLMKQGKIFKREWFKYFKKEILNGEMHFITTDGRKVALNDLKCYQTCDMAISKKETADYFVVLTFGVDDLGNIYIFNLMRGRYSWNEQKRYVPENYRRNSPLCWLGIESNQFQTALADEVNVFTDISVKKLMPKGDKVSRAMGMSAKFETGKVYIWNKLPSLGDFEDELTAFPEGQHDDIVDTVGYIPQCTTSGRAKVYVN